MKNLTFLLFFVPLVGCTDLPKVLDEQALSNDINIDKTIVLKNYTSFEWDRVYVFPPYTPKDKVKRESGLRKTTVIDTSDSITLLVFKDQGLVVTYFEVKRYKADFSELYKEGGHSVSEAEFFVEHRDSWKYLVANKSVGGTPRGSASVVPPL